MKIFYDITEKCLRDISENISRLLFTLCLIYFSSTFTWFLFNRFYFHSTLSSSHLLSSLVLFLFFIGLSFLYWLLFYFSASPSMSLFQITQLCAYLMISLPSRIIITQFSCHVGGLWDLQEMCVATVLIKNLQTALQWWCWTKGTSCDVWLVLSHTKEKNTHTV